jgi:hypothetical protein
VWENIAVGQADNIRLAVICPQNDPSQWAILIDTPLLHLWLEMPDHTVIHQALSFFERTRGKKWPVRVDITIGTFCGRRVLLTKNDDDERYFVELLPPQGGGGVSDGYFFLRIEENMVGDVVSALRETVKALDGKSGRS